MPAGGRELWPREGSHPTDLTTRPPMATDWAVLVAISGQHPRRSTGRFKAAPGQLPLAVDSIRVCQNRAMLALRLESTRSSVGDRLCLWVNPGKVPLFATPPLAERLYRLAKSTDSQARLRLIWAADRARRGIFSYPGSWRNENPAHPELSPSHRGENAGDGGRVTPASDGERVPESRGLLRGDASVAARCELIDTGKATNPVTLMCALLPVPRTTTEPPAGIRSARPRSSRWW